MQYLKFTKDSKDPKKPSDHQFDVFENDGWVLPRQVFSKDGKDISTIPSKLILDSGSSLTQLPHLLASAINGGTAWDPPAVLSEQSLWVVSCLSKPPQVGMKFGNRTLFFAAEDMIYSGMNGQCISGIQPGNTLIAGGSFMKNVIAVMDIGAAEIHLSQRTR